MHTAYAQTDDPTVVEMLVEAEADIDAREEDDRTALMLAAERSRTEIAKVLLHFGANVNEQDKDGKTALMYAVKQQNSWQGSSDPELIDVLLEAGADVNEKSEDGMTALMFATKDVSAVDKLLRAGAFFFIFILRY